MDFARSLGADFRVVDLRWGIPDEASHRHSVVEMCLGEVDRALNADLEPRLPWLLGQLRAGGPCLRGFCRCTFEWLDAAVQLRRPAPMLQSTKRPSS